MLNVPVNWTSAKVVGITTEIKEVHVKTGEFGLGVQPVLLARAEKFTDSKETQDPNIPVRLAVVPDA